jgi:hypothetical protein
LDCRSVNIRNSSVRHSNFESLAIDIAESHGRIKDPFNAAVATPFREEDRSVFVLKIIVNPNTFVALPRLTEEN